MAKKKNILIVLLSLSFAFSSLFLFAADEVRAEGQEDKEEETRKITLYTQTKEAKEIEYELNSDTSILEFVKNEDLLNQEEGVRFYSDGMYKDQIDGNTTPEALRKQLKAALESQGKTSEASEIDDLNLPIYIVDGDEHLVNFHIISYAGVGGGNIKIKDEIKAIKPVGEDSTPAASVGGTLQAARWFEDKEGIKLAKRVLSDTDLYAFDKVNDKDYFYDPESGLLVQIEQGAFENEEDGVNLVMVRKPTPYKLVNSKGNEIDSENISFYFVNDEEKKIMPEKGGMLIWLPLPDQIEVDYRDYEVVEVNSANSNKNVVYKSEDMDFAAYQTKDQPSKLVRSLVIYDENLLPEYNFVVAKTHGQAVELVDPNLIDGTDTNISGPNLYQKKPASANLATSSKTYQMPDGSYMTECYPSGIRLYYEAGTFAGNEAQVRPEIYSLDYSIGSVAGPIKNVALSLGFTLQGRYIDPAMKISLEVPFRGLNARLLDIFRYSGANEYKTLAGTVTNSYVKFDIVASGDYIIAESATVDKSTLQLANKGIQIPTGSNVIGQVQTPVTGEYDMSIFIICAMATAAALTGLRKKF